MAFGPTSPGSVIVAVILSVYDSDLADTRTLRLANGNWHDTAGLLGTKDAEYDGRLYKATIKFPNQRLFGGSWTYPTFTAQVGEMDHGDLYTFWDTYLDGAVTWNGGTANVYLVDTVNDEYQLKLRGKITEGPRSVRRGEGFTLTVTEKHHNTRLANRYYSPPSASYGDFIQPRTYDSVKLDSAVDATETTLLLSSANTHWVEGRVATILSEACYISGTSGVPGNSAALFVRRGWGGTTADSHVATQAVRVVRASVTGGMAPSGSQDTLIPYLFGQQAANQGIVTQIFPVTLTGTKKCAYVSMGVIKAGQVGRVWTENDGEIWEFQAGASAGSAGKFTYHADAWSAPDGGWLGGNNASIRHPMPAGTYVCTPSATTYDQDGDRFWIRCNGIDINETSSGAAHRFPVGISNYLFQNSLYGLGEADAFFSNAITSWDSGTWQAEYATDAYAEHLEGQYPEFGATEAPMAMDAIKDIANAVGSDIFYKRGYIYPKRRTVGRATWTITADELRDNLPELLFDPYGDYCNVLRFGYENPWLSEPADGTDRDPVEVPSEVIVWNDDAVTENNGEEVKREIKTKWTRFRMADTWSQAADPETNDDQRAHLEYLRAAADDHIAYLSRPQLYIRANLAPLEYLTVEQGDGIAFSVSGYPSLVGQVREVVIDCSDMSVEVLTWISCNGSFR